MPCDLRRPRTSRFQTRGAAALVLALLAPAAPAQAQDPVQIPVPGDEEPEAPRVRNAFVADPVLSRGSLLFHVEGGGLSMTRLYQGIPGQQGTDRPGHFLLLPELGVDHAPGLAPTEDRLRALTASDQAPRLVLGATRGRFSSNEQVIPMRVSYGLLDRVTLGVTVPVVRRRVDALLRLSPDGANVGRNPALDPDGPVTPFLTQSQGALADLQAAVDDWCAQAGEEDARCQEGRALAQEMEAFLTDLSAAYDEEALFPRAGSDLGALLSGRWAGFREGAQEWEVASPDALPLSLQGVDEETFRSQVVEPAWGATGFPLETPRAFLLLGDVEAHVSVALLQGRADDPGPVRVRSALVGTVRFPTGTPDSLRIVAPLDPPRGVGGVELRSVTDVLLPGRFAALAVVEVGTHGTRELTLLAPDPDQPFVPGATRTEARWSPGDHLRISVTPRYHLRPALSLGAGWRYLARRPDRYESMVPDGPPIFQADRGPRLHHLELELRFSAMEPPMVEALRFPLEVFVRGSRTVSGSGPLAAAERRLQIGGRLVLLR
jgi:hypothetical protein